MKNKTYNKKAMIFIIVLIMVGVLVFIYSRLINKKPTQTVSSPSEMVSEINRAHRFNLLLTDEQEEAALRSSSQSLQTWQRFIDSYQYNQPEEYKRTRDWDKKMNEILKHEKKANELIREGRMNEARQELNNSRLIFSQIKKENGILDITDELLEFYEVIKKVQSSEKKADVLVHLGDLKYKFTKLKRHNFEDKYSALLYQLEENIGYLDKLLDGPDYKNAQSKLEPLFLEIFMNY